MKIEQNVGLKQFSHFKIGGTARFFCEARNEADIQKAVTQARKHKSRIFILGGGTNILLDDAGFNGFVIKPALAKLSTNGREVKVGAGTSMHELVMFTAERGLQGLEWAGGLPGTVGGAIRGNAGAFKEEIKATIISSP